MKNYMCLCIFMLIICIATRPVTSVARSEVFFNGTDRHLEGLLNRDKRQTTGGKCILPPYPDHGTYTVEKHRAARPGETLDSFVLKVTCRRGFGVVDTEATDWDGLVYCVNGEWYQQMPQCVRFCKLDPHPSVTYTCQGPGGGLRKCKNYVAPGTLVNPACNRPIYQSTEDLPNMMCSFGFFDYIAKCKAECGLVTPEGVQLVINGTTAKRGELPWHVGIYRKTTRPYMQICGGSIISNNVVISGSDMFVFIAAAHCFWSDVRKLLPAANFAVAIGKIYRPWDHEKDIGVQKSDIKEIRVPRLFRGQETNFQEDIAVLILATPFLYQTHIRPVCFSFNIKFDNFQLRHGKLGKVAGWGLTAANGNPSSILKVINMPFINEETCYESFPQSFSEYFTSDKFCAGFTNGTTLCHGDSGGGLAFPQEELDIYRYYLRGIVSTAPKHNENLCNENSYTTFTRITKHQEFINKALAASAEKTCPLYSFQCADGTCVNPLADCNGRRECSDGSDEADDLCIPQVEVFNQSTCILPPYPDHGTYTADNNPSARPGEAFEYISLSITCSPGYGLRDPGTKNQLACIQGTWNQEMPTCVRVCKLEPHPSVSYICEVPGSVEKLCNNYVVDGTTVNPRCNAPNYYSPTVLRKMTCVGGSWDYIALCSPECGRVTPKGDTLVLGGEQAERGELPWHVGIYSKAYSPYMQICGGSIVSNDKVISAAHCFWGNEKGLLPAANYAVAGGKLYRPWDYEKDLDAQKSEIKEIKVPKLFRGDSTNFQDDIAVLTLTTPFVYKPYLRPICLDFDRTFDRRQLQPGNLGKVAGWGLTSANGTASPVLRVVQMPYVNVDECINSVPQSFVSYITSDKFCAGYTNGTAALCRGDTGAALAFPDIAQGVQRYYLRGIPSTAPTHEEKLCNDEVYITFTRITKHEHFITDNL